MNLDRAPWCNLSIDNEGRLMTRKKVNFCNYANQWIVWDNVRREVVGYFQTKREADFCASQLELF